MKLVQKVLSHGLLIAFFVAVFFIYLYRIELFPQWFGKETQSVASQTESMPAARTTAPERGSQPVQGTSRTDTGAATGAAVPAAGDDADPGSPPSAAQPPAVAAPQDSAAGQSPGMTEAAPVSGQVAQAVADKPASSADVSAPEFRPLQQGQSSAPPADVTPPQQAGSGESGVAAVPPTAEPAAAESVTAAGSAADAADDFQARLQQAREYFWRQDMDAAVQAYQGLTESFPDRAEAWGELGNLYFNQQQTAAAADAYYQAIGLLIEQGETEQARSLLGVMYSLDADKANELEKRLRQTGS